MRRFHGRKAWAFAQTLEKLHQEMDLALFPERVFAVVGDLLPDVFMVAQEFDTRTQQARSVLSSPAPEGLIDRCAELIPVEHPIYHAIQKGAHGAMRLSDFLSLRELRDTGFFSEIFRPLHVRYEIVLPLCVPHHVAGFTISRDRDFSDEELGMARALAPHLELAHVHAQRITALRRLQTAPLPTLGELAGLGLTSREAEVLYWIIQGKRDGEIAEILASRRRTVEAHVRSIFSKLHVETRTAAAVEAVQRVCQAMSVGLPIPRPLSPS